MTKAAPAFQFYAADYLADEKVQIMTLEDEGCYVRLMAYGWREGSIPEDPEMQARLCKGVKPSDLVIGCFKGGVQNGAPEGRLVHPRLEFERAKQAEWKAKSADGGRKSAHKRKHRKALGGEQGGSTTVPRVVQPKGNSSSSFSSSSSNKKHTYKAGRRAPENFVVTEELRQWAKKEVPDADIAAETRLFLDHEFEKTKTDWPAAWRNWLRNAPKFKPIVHHGNSKSYKPDTIGQAPEDTGEQDDPEYRAEVNRRSMKLFGGMS
jgi:uncharacterized protein YdaU (DUF1376 family)